jgi:predicted nucleic acid-binding protein
MASLPFLDTNVLLRHLRADHAEHSPRATAYLERIEREELKVRTADTVIFETVFTLERSYRQPKAAIRDALLPLITLPGIVLPRKRRFQTAFTFYVDLNISFADAYHAALMLEQKLSEVVTFDRHFDRIPGIARVEP